MAADEEPFLGDMDPPYTVADFVADTAQTCQMIVELITAGREPEAMERALEHAHRARGWLRRLNTAARPEIDINKTLDTGHRSLWDYKTNSDPYDLGGLRGQFRPDGSEHDPDA
jgi:hypothetical protein